MADHATNFVDEQEAASLSRRLRVAWAAAVYSEVLPLYSPYFRERFLQQDALDIAWRYAAGEGVDGAHVAEMLQRMEDLIPRAEDEDYGHNAMFPGMLLLTDLTGHEQQGGVQAVDNVAVMFAAHYLYRQGIGGFDPAIPQEYESNLEMVVYRHARRVYDAVCDWPDRPVSRELFRAFAMQWHVPLLDLAVLLRRRTKPPPAEAEFIRQQGWS